MRSYIALQPANTTPSSASLRSLLGQSGNPASSSLQGDTTEAYLSGGKRRVVTLILPNPACTRFPHRHLASVYIYLSLSSTRAIKAPTKQTRRFSQETPTSLTVIRCKAKRHGTRALSKRFFLLPKTTLPTLSSREVKTVIASKFRSVPFPR